MITAKALKEIDEIFELLSGHPPSKVKNPLVLFSRFERWLILTTISSFVLGAVLAISGRSTSHSAALLDGARLSLLLAIIGAWTLQVWGVAGSLKYFLQPVQSILRAQTNRAKSDHQLLLNLRRHPAPLVEYVGRRLSMAVEHVRGRIGIMAGAIDKVGIIPLFIGWLFAGQKFVHEIDRRSLIAATAGFGVLYLLCVIAMMASYRVEELAQLAECAFDDDEHSSKYD